MGFLVAVSATVYFFDAFALFPEGSASTMQMNLATTRFR
ncbi:hypothetical protein VCHENC03_0027 [Vibrio sp. HENC-03]|nr:hypothetical protein VCHENC03_0027 [Vibrio sp. HENC-03]